LPTRGSNNILITDKDTIFRTSGAPGPKDIVVSFFKREPVLVGAVTVVSVSGATGVQDVEIWTSNTSAETGFVQVASGSVPRDDRVNQLPENTFRFSPAEARFVKIRLVRNYQQQESLQVSALIAAGHPARKQPPADNDELAALGALARLIPANTDTRTLRSIINMRRAAAVKVVVKTREAAEAQSAILLNATAKETANTEGAADEAIADHWWVQTVPGGPQLF
jgi:hypothetical protein